MVSPPQPGPTIEFLIKKTVDQWITFEVKIEKYENLLSLDQMTMIGDYISALAKVTRCVNLKVDCFTKFLLKLFFINGHWT